MKFIYGIICHRITNPLVFLVTELLKSEKSIVIIHVDKKYNLEDIRNKLPNHINLHFIYKRIDVRWGAYSQIECTLSLLKKADEFDYKYFSLLSGDDVPLKPVNDIEFFLERNFGEYISIDYDNLNSREHTLNRVKFKYPNFYFSRIRSFKSKFLCKFFDILFKIGFMNQDLKKLPKVYKGSNWFTLSSNAVEYVLNFLKKNINYDSFYKKSFCADEIYFHTILCNSEFLNKIEINQNYNALRYIDWKNGPDFPRTLNESDFEKMKNSKMLFARKLDPNISLNILEQMIKKEP